MAGAWLEVFKTGTHTSGNGITKSYTDDDLDAIVKTYNGQADHEAPLVLGHPNTDDPAYGWTKELKAAGGKLLAYIDQVNDSIVDAVKRGEYKKVSIALYPGGLLRHIGLLGAAPPAVKGLSPVQFSEEQMEFDEYIIATDETRMPIVARILSGLRDIFIEKFGLDLTNKAINKEDIDYLQDPAASKIFTINEQQRIVPQENINIAPPGAITNYSEEAQKQQEEEGMDELKAKIKTLEDALEAQAAQFASQFTEMTNSVKSLTELVSTQAQEKAEKLKMSAYETAKTAFASFCESLIQEGKVLPAEKDGIVDEYADLLTAEETLTFAEDAVKPSDKMKQRLGSRQVLFAVRPPVFADPKKAMPPALGANAIPEAFAEMSGVLDISSIELDKNIKDYAKEHNVTYEEAAAKYTAA